MNYKKEADIKMEEKIKSYISEALKRNHSIEDITAKLSSAGYNNEMIKKLAKEAVQERIIELENIKSRGVSNEALGMVFSVFLRGLAGIAAVWVLINIVAG